MSDTPPIEADPRHWQVVRDILRRHLPTHTVWAFGSRATRTARRYSDLDLAVISDAPLPPDVLPALREAFSDSDLPWRVDVLDWSTLSPAFQTIVARGKVVVQEPV
jgi:predicted nucleotidyltransferase